MTDLLYWCALLISTFFMGFSIKYIDAAYDERAFDRKNALATSVVSALLMGYWIAVDPIAAIFLLAICISVAITKKIDNPAFVLGILVVFLVPALIVETITIIWLPLAALVIAGVIDEEGNDVVSRIPWKPLRAFFHYRSSMEVMMAVLTLIGFFEWPYFFAFVIFDIGYQMVTYYVDKKTGAVSPL